MELNKFAFALLTLSLHAEPSFKCGEKKTIKEPYGLVELRADCELTEGRMWVAEFQGDVPNGFSMGFDRATQKKTDSVFYKNGKEEGTSKCWDSMGNVSCVNHHHNGFQVGKSEGYFSPGHLSLIKNYNDSGQEEGSWQEWWPNGNKKMVAECHKGLIISDEEYFPDGKLRFKEKSTYEPPERDQKVIFLETFSPSGKSTGTVVNGKGDVWLFGEKPDSSLKRYSVSHSIFKDSLRVSGEEADAKTVEKLMQ